MRVDISEDSPFDVRPSSLKMFRASVYPAETSLVDAELAEHLNVLNWSDISH